METIIDRSNDQTSKSRGLQSWRPPWFQKFISFKTFMLLYMILSGTQTIILSYLTVVLSTVEKEFGLQSKEAAWVYSGNEISQILFIVFLPFVGRAKRRPLLIGIAGVVSAIGMLLIAVPHFAGRGKEFESEFINSQEDSANSCGIANQLQDSCNKESAKDWIGISIVFIGILLVGFGNAAILSLGTPYIDDNIGKKSSPMALSLGFSARVAGPAIGYVIGFFCLKDFVSPGNKPEGIDEDSSLWIGAWWKGCVIVGFFLIFVSPFMMLFPSELPISGKERSNSESEQIKREEIETNSTTRVFWHETYDMGRRLVRNKIYVLHIFATMFILAVVVGFATFLPKYFEYMFRKRASTSIVGPATKSIAAVFGLLSAGAVVTKWRPRARILIGSSIISTTITIASFLAFSQIGCPPLKFYGIHTTGSESIDFSNLNCNKNQGCSSEEYKPICSVDGETHFFSPCQAGCRMCETKSVEEKNITLYKECTCVTANSIETGKTFANDWPTSWPSRSDLPPATLSEDINSAYSGYCPSECQSQFYLVLAVFGFVGFVLSANRLPSLLVFMRAVEPRDKTTAFTFTVSFLSLFALIPGPLIYGAIFDSACTVWGKKCGEKLNCFAYDTDLLRVRAGVCSAVLLCFALCCELGIFYYGKNLKIYDEDDNEKESNNIEENHTTITNDMTDSSEMELGETKISS